VAGITDPAAKSLFSAVQGVSSPAGTVSNTAPLGTNVIAFSGKIDWNMTQKDTLAGRYGYNYQEDQSPSLTFITSNLPTNGARSVVRPQTITLNYTRAQSASMVINNLTGFSRSNPVFIPLADITAPTVQWQNGLAEL